MTTILNSAMLDSDTAILDSDTLLSSLRFTQKHSPSTLTLTQTNSIWPTRWWQPSWILPSWIQPCCTKLWLNLIQSDSNPFILTELADGSHLQLCHHGFTHFAQKELHSFILTQLDDGSHLEFCHLNSFSQTHSQLPRVVTNICTKKLHSFILTQLDDCRYLDICHPQFSHFVEKNFTHSFWLKLKMTAILNSAMLDSNTAILDSDTLLFFLKFTQKHSPSNLTLPQTNSIWLT